MNTARLSCKTWQEEMAVRCILRGGQRETTLQRRRNTKEQLGWAEELINAQPSSSIFSNLTVLSSSVSLGCPVVTVFCLLSLIWKMPSQHPQHLQQQWEQNCAMIPSLKEQWRDAAPEVSFKTHPHNQQEMTNQGMPQPPPLCPRQVTAQLHRILFQALAKFKFNSQGASACKIPPVFHLKHIKKQISVLCPKQLLPIHLHTSKKGLIKMPYLFSLYKFHFCYLICSSVEIQEEKWSKWL